ncbi:DUF1310 family protein [Streptococcus sp. H31]|uniref:DUF1310 family protein n=1 Tax=Streptococcus huangxiaojuni TaxID=3237239 RepID=UPI0034A34081
MRKLLLILAGIAAAVGIAIGGWEVKEQIEHKQMVEIVKSEEVEKIIEDDLKEMSADALTDKGVIKSYQIDDDSIQHNPMGGINFMIYVNNDKNMYVFYTINKDLETGRLVNDGGGNSAKFERLITEDKSE